MSFLAGSLKGEPRRGRGQWAAENQQTGTRRRWQVQTVVVRGHVVADERRNRGRRGHADPEPQTPKGRCAGADQPIGIVITYTYFTLLFMAYSRSNERITASYSARCQRVTGVRYRVFIPRLGISS